MKLIFLLSIFFLLQNCFSLYAQGIEKRVLTAIDQTEEYDAQKIERIQTIRNQLNNLDSRDTLQIYSLNRELYNEYRIFKQDSAFQYGLKLQKLAKDLDSLPLVAAAAFNLADISVSAGMYKEALEFMQITKEVELPENMRSLYYGLYGRLYNEMAEYSNLSYYTRNYLDKAATYRKAALNYTEPGTFFNLFLQSFIEYKHGSLQQAVSGFRELLKMDLSLRDQALLHYSLGDIYSQLNRKDEALHHFAEASIADIKSSTKETLAMIRLAELYFEKGQTKTASVLIRKANEDAALYGAQQRKLRVAAILPIIEEQMVSQIEKQRAKLYQRNIILTFFIVFVLILAMVIYFQVIKMQEARKIIEKAHSELQRTNQKISSANNQLNLLNDKLLEANKIKEEYIGFFFTQDADIFEKFKEFKTKIELSAGEGKLDRVKYLLSTYDLNKEKEKLLRNFDEAFIKLFPNFIAEFNSLLRVDEQIKIKKGKILNKELRIFALIRLGITQNEIIAQILGYSVNSIYAYKTKLRNKSLVDNRDFDQKLMENTTLKL